MSVDISSGLLTAYVFLKETAKTKLSPGLMIKYYLHRAWRITPPYMIALMISACLTRYLGDGPLYPEGGFEMNYCTDTWWTNLLYVNNLVNTDKGLCFAVSWFLANDMQMHVIAPLMLIPFAIGRKLIAFGVIIALIVTHIVATALVINHYPGTEYGSFPTATNALAGFVYFDKVYIKPWCRVGPYAIGILLGYLLVNHKQRPKLNSRLNVVLSTLSIATLALMLYGIYPNTTEHPIGRVANILYQASSRNIWSLGLAFIIYSCIVNGGLINKILSLPVWVPLSRLSFALYLIHYTIITYYVSIQEKPIHLQDSSLIFIFLGSISTSLFGAYLLSMIFEVPLIGLEKFVFKRH